MKFQPSDSEYSFAALNQTKRHEVSHQSIPTEIVTRAAFVANSIFHMTLLMVIDSAVTPQTEGQIANSLSAEYSREMVRQGVGELISFGYLTRNDKEQLELVLIER